MAKLCPKGKVRSSAKNGGLQTKKSYTKEDGKYYDTKGRELNVSVNKSKGKGTSRISLKKNRSRPTKFSEGGMVIEDMTRTIEV